MNKQQARWPRIGSREAPTDTCPECGAKGTRSKQGCRISPDGQRGYCFRKGGNWARPDAPSAPPGGFRPMPAAAPEDDGPIIIRDDDRANRIDRAYRALLKRLPISTGHYSALRERPMFREEAEVLGAGTLPSDLGARRRAFEAATETTPDIKVPGLLYGRKTVMDAPGMLIPVRDVYRRIVAIRVRRDQSKVGQSNYCWLSTKDSPTKARCHVAFPIPHDEDPPEPDHPGRAFITEGEIKATITANYTRCPCISLPGVSPPGRRQKQEAIETLRVLQANEVVIAFDQDYPVNNAVQKARSELTSELNAAGFRVLWAKWETSDKGIDDALVNAAAIDYELADFTCWHKKPQKPSLRWLLRALPYGTGPEHALAQSLAACGTWRIHEQCNESLVDLKSPVPVTCGNPNCFTCRPWMAELAGWSIGHHDSPDLWPDYVIAMRWHQRWKPLGLLDRGTHERIHPIGEAAGRAKCAMLKAMHSDKYAVPDIRWVYERDNLFVVAPMKWGGDLHLVPLKFSPECPQESPGVDAKNPGPQPAPSQGDEYKLAFVGTPDMYRLLGFVDVEVLPREKAIERYKNALGNMAELFREQCLQADAIKDPDEREDAIERLRRRWAYGRRKRHYTDKMKNGLPSGLTDASRKFARKVRAEAAHKDTEPCRCHLHKDRDHPCTPRWSIEDTVVKQVIITSDEPFNRNDLKKIVRENMVPLPESVPAPEHTIKFYEIPEHLKRHRTTSTRSSAKRRAMNC